MLKSLICGLLNLNKICLDWCKCLVGLLIQWLWPDSSWLDSSFDLILLHSLVWYTFVFSVASPMAVVWSWKIPSKVEWDMKHLNCNSQFVGGCAGGFNAEVNRRKTLGRRRWRLMNLGWQISLHGLRRKAEPSWLRADQVNTHSEARSSGGGVLLY